MPKATEPRSKNHPENLIWNTVTSWSRQSAKLTSYAFDQNRINREAERCWCTAGSLEHTQTHTVRYATGFHVSHWAEGPPGRDSNDSRTHISFSFISSTQQTQHFIIYYCWLRWTKARVLSLRTSRSQIWPLIIAFQQKGGKNCKMSTEMVKEM